jgi:hypothetical protein
MTKRVFDCFTFFNELDLLELRLNELDGAVDFFVIAEAPVTFKGQPKALVFQANQARFAKFREKIIHLVIADMPQQVERAWDRENFQRNALRLGLAGAAPEDIVIISDADEIVRPSTVAALRRGEGFFQLGMPMFQYYMNLRESQNWTKVFAFSRHLLDEIGDFNWVRMMQDDAFEKFAGRNTKLTNAGWHFTYLGGAAKIREKLQSFSHDEAWYQRMLTPGGIEAQVIAGFSVGNTWYFNTFCPVDDSYPGYVIANQKRYREMGFIKDPYDALAEMQLLIRNSYLTVMQERDRLAKAEAQYEAMLARFRDREG